MKLPDELEPLLEKRLATHAFTESEHLQTAVGFVSRTVFPLLEKDAPGSEDEVLYRDDLIRLVDEVYTRLKTVA